jgi:hypothetical protein
MLRGPFAAACFLALGCTGAVVIVADGETGGHGGEGAATVGGSGGAGASGGSGAGPLACTGDIAWARHLGNASDQVAHALTVNGNGHLFLAGKLAGALDIDGHTIASGGSSDIYLASFDADGQLRWGKSFGDAGEQTGPLFLAPTPAGGVVLAGAFSGTVDFGGGARTAGGEDAFVASFDDGGNHLWTNVFESRDAFEKVIDAGVDPASGDVVVGGAFETEIDLGGGPLPNGVDDGFVARFDASGRHLWSRAISGAGAQYVQTVDVDALGRIAFGGSTTGDLDLGAGPLPYAGDGEPDAFAALYDAAATPIWTKLWADPGREFVFRIRFTTNGFVLGGELDGSLAFDGSPPIAAQPGVFAARLSTAGDHVASRAFENLAHIRAFAVDGDQALIAGPFAAMIDSPSGPIETVGGNDGLALGLTSTVGYAWTLPIGSPGDDDAHGIAVDASSNVYVAAHFRDDVTIPGCGTFENRGGWDLLLLARRP